ncbi:MAG: hypothetical protein HDS54_00140 [Barnesiella sp.]|nr:hypothetical protein [Barnesiella sp.]
MDIISWNINGLRSGFAELKELAKTYSPDFICLQKVRCDNDREQYEIDGYRALYAPIDCGNNSGVMTYAKIPAVTNPNVSTLSKAERVHTIELSKDGHLQIFDCDSFFLVNAYVPFSNTSLAGAVDARKNWDNMLRNCIVECASLKPVVICGDLNVVHTQKDTCEKRLVQNRGCFFEWERDNFNALLREANLIDAFRYLHPDEQAVSFYGNYRSMQIGNRIDYFLISSSMLSGLIASEILSDFGNGQSAPVSIHFEVQRLA